MAISRVNAEAAQQIRNTLLVFRGGAIFIPKKWYFTPFISLLTRNTQPFHPRREGLPGTETIFRHTLKCMVVLNCFLENKPDQIKIDEISFPLRNTVEPLVILRRIIEQSRLVFDLPVIINQPRLVRILDVFVLYHDIGKRTGDRRDHERKGAEQFLAANRFFGRFLTDREIQTIYLLTKYHGVYGQIDAARRKGQPLPNYDGFLTEMRESVFSPSEKEFIIKILFLFNIVEGLQSDIFAADFYSPDKFEDILRHFEMVSKKACLS